MGDCEPTQIATESAEGEAAHDTSSIGVTTVLAAGLAALQSGISAVDTPRSTKSARDAELDASRSEMIADRRDREARSAMQSAEVLILDPRLARAHTRSARYGVRCRRPLCVLCGLARVLGENTGKFFAGLEGVGALKGPVVFTEAQMLIHAITAPSFSIENTS